jgi:hypothetical protein
MMLLFLPDIEFRQIVWADRKISSTSKLQTTTYKLQVQVNYELQVQVSYKLQVQVRYKVQVANYDNK